MTQEELLTAEDNFQKSNPEIPSRYIVHFIGGTTLQINSFQVNHEGVCSAFEQETSRYNTHMVKIGNVIFERENL